MTLLQIVKQYPILKDWLGRYPLLKSYVIYESIQPIVYLTALDDCRVALAYLAEDTKDHQITLLWNVTREIVYNFMSNEYSLDFINDISPIAVCEYVDTGDVEVRLTNLKNYSIFKELICQLHQILLLP